MQSDAVTEDQEYQGLKKRKCYMCEWKYIENVDFVPYGVLGLTYCHFVLFLIVFIVNYSMCSKEANEDDVCVSHKCTYVYFMCRGWSY